MDNPTGFPVPFPAFSLCSQPLIFFSVSSSMTSVKAPPEKLIAWRRGISCIMAAIMSAVLSPRAVSFSLSESMIFTFRISSCATAAALGSLIRSPNVLLRVKVLGTRTVEWTLTGRERTRSRELLAAHRVYSPVSTCQSWSWVL